MPSSIDKLLSAIGYPDEPRAEGAARVILVDDAEIRLEEHSDGRLLFVRRLHHFDEEHFDRDSAILSRLAGYAAGRLLKEEAVLAWDEADASLILWQECGTGSDAASLRRAINLFLASCDWWCERLDTDSRSTIASPDASPFPEIFIRP